MFEEKWGAWAPDQRNRLNPGATVAKNVYPALDSYLPVSSLSTSTSALASRALGGVTVRDRSNGVYVYVGTKNEIYRITDSPSVSSDGYTTAENDRWEFVTWGDQVIGTNYSDPAQVSDIGGGGFTPLGGSPPKSKTIAVVKNQVVLGNINDTLDGLKPGRIHWSAINDPTGWTPGNSQSDIRDLKGDGGWIKKIVGGEFGIIFQEHAIWRMTYVGAPVVFQLDKIESSRGTPTGGSVVNHGRMIYFLSKDGFYILEDGVRSRNISSEICSRFFYADADRSKFDKISAAIDPVKNLVFWAYQRKNSPDDCLNRVLVYNWVTKRWSYLDLCLDMIMSSATFSKTLEELDSYGTLNDLPASLDSDIWRSDNLSLAGINNKHEFGYFTGPAMTAVLESKEFGSDDRQIVNMFRSYTEGAGQQTIEVLSRNALNEQPKSSGPVSPNDRGRAHFRSNARFHRVRETIEGGFTHASGGFVEVIEGGGR